MRTIGVSLARRYQTCGLTSLARGIVLAGDYAKYNDTDALVRQRVWYALRRSGLTFAFPTRTLHLERKVTTRPITLEEQIADRLSAVDVFSPLSTEELRQLATATVGHVFAPGETLIRAGDKGSSMFVVHNGRVEVQVAENGRPRTVAVRPKEISLAKWVSSPANLAPPASSP